jgi:hypothetical protein
MADSRDVGKRVVAEKLVATVGSPGAGFELEIHATIHDATACQVFFVFLRVSIL